MNNILLYGSDGQTQIKNLMEWEIYGAPTKNSHWKRGRSAYETACSWLPRDKPGVPSEFMDILSGTELEELELQFAIAEHQTKFEDTSNGPRNHDLLIIANHHKSKVVIGLEGKEREKFDKVLRIKIKEALKSSSNSKLPARVNSFCNGILGFPYSKSNENIHYQFLSGIAGVAVEVKKRNAKFGMFVVQQIVSNETPKSDVLYNDESYDSFVRLMNKGYAINSSLVGPFELVGSDLIPSIKIYIAKFKTFVKL